jgi:hypothetical protein
MSRLAPMLLCLLFLTVPAWADGGDTANGPAELTVTVVDQTGAALVTARVTVVDAAGVPVSAPVDERGQATFTALELDTYQVRAEAEAFEPFGGSLTLKTGNNAVTIELPLAGLTEEVLVETSTADDEGNGFTTTLGEQELAELPDDPDELQQVLEQMAGPGATIRVNGFRGGRLPPKSQIQSVRFRMNSYAAENHEAGGFGIDIITRPGGDSWRGMTNFGFRDDAMNARNAFAPTLGPEQYRRFGFNADGPIVRNKTSLALNVDLNSSYDSQTIVATTPDQIINSLVERPEERLFASARLDHQLTQSQLMRLEFRRESRDRENLGVGDFDLQERAYNTTGYENSLRFSLNGLIAPKVAHELKVRFETNRTRTSSLSLDPAVIVIDAFSTGGAGQEGDRRSKAVEIEDNVDWELGKQHRMRAGVQLETAWYDSDELRNGNGTWTFGGLTQYELGIATTYTQRVGSTLVTYNQTQAAVYVQDDWTPFKSLSISLGLRQEMQSHLDDVWNLAPRVGFSWAPGKYTVRGGYGLFYDWYESSLYEQTLRVNGVTQQEIVVQRPLYPDPTGGIIGTPLPPSKLQADPNLEMPYLHQASLGIERTFLEALRVRAMYTRQRGRNQFRAVNLNAPLPIIGDRPDPSLGNVTQLISTGRSEVDQLRVDVNYMKPEKRLFMGVHYTLGRTHNFSDSAFALPADNYDLDAEWGPSTQDVRHRLFAMINFGLPRNLRLGLFSQALSARPYNIITGFDNNSDTVVNDRPEGVGRNSARGAASWNLNARLSRAFSFGPQSQTEGDQPPMRMRGRRGRMMMDSGGSRYQVEFYVQAFNILNRTNLVSFSGNQRSPYFGQATSAMSARRIEVGMNFGF